MINLKNLKAVNETILELNLLNRWSSFIDESKYNELSKQALNCLIAYVLGSYSEVSGISVKWENFPKIALYRSFQKANILFDMPKDVIDEMCKVGKIDMEMLDNATWQIITELTDENLSEFLKEGIDTYETNIYKAASKVATYIELLENRSKISETNQQEYNIIFQETLQVLNEYNDIPGVKEISDVSGDLFKIFQQISQLRNQKRWKVRATPIRCSILGHLFDTAIFGWIMSLEQNQDDEELAAMVFFMCIYHDVAERWTTDIQSPIKDRIPGFRKVTEEFELKVIEQNIYQKVPDFLVDYLKKVMFEDEENVSYKKLIKGADYLSADSECWRFCISGTRDRYFQKAINGRKSKIESGKVLLTPTCGQLHEYFKSYINNLNLPD